MNILEISKSSSEKTEFSFFPVFISSVFVFFNTDVGDGFGFFKYRDIGFGFRLPTRLYPRRHFHSPAATVPTTRITSAGWQVTPYGM